MIRTVDCRDFSCSVFDSGSGSPWLFVHGFPLDHTMWRFQLEHAPEGRRVVAPDLRGFGESGGAGDSPITMDDFADDLGVLLDQLEIDQPITLCGLSMGGYVALAFWRRHRARLKRLVLCDTRAAADDEATRKARELTARRVLRQGTGFLVETMIPKLFSSHTRDAHPDRVEETAEVIRRADPLAVAGALRGMARRQDMTETLPQIDVPTTIIVGEEDRITPADEMAAMAKVMPQSEFHVIPQAGHMAPLEAPELFAKIILSHPSM